MPPQDVMLWLVIIVAVFACGMAWILAGMHPGPAILCAIVFAVPIYLFPYQSYHEADQKWTAVTSLVEGKQVEAIRVTYFRGKIDKSKTYYLQEAFKGAAVVPKVGEKVISRNIDECELDVEMKSASKIKVNLEEALTDLFECKTSVT